MDGEKRNRIGKIASIIGILVNVVIALAKMAVGAFFGIISLLADGINNFTDCGSSIISLISFKLSSKPADKEHPFGHERIEYICSMVVAFIILLIASSILVESVKKILNPTEITFSLWVIFALLFSLVAKLFLFFYYRNTAKKINSQILKVSSIDSLIDCFSTMTVFIAFIVASVWGVNVDGYIGILVSIIIGLSGVGVLKEVFSNLIGQAPESSLLLEIKQKILSYPGVLGVHDLSVYCYGPNKYFASAHVEVDAKEDILVSHELVDKIEKDFMSSMNIMLTGHLDPIVTDDERVNTLKEKIEKIVENIDSSFSIHDFRMVFGINQTNVLFDVAVPYESTISKEEIREILEREVAKIDKKYCLVITIESCI